MKIKTYLKKILITTVIITPFFVNCISKKYKNQGIVSKTTPVIHHIDENVWAVTNLYHSAGQLAEVSAGIIFTNHSIIFIDAGMTVATGEYLWEIAKKNAQGRDKMYLILTHHHSDHVFGMRTIKEKGATVIAHQGINEILSNDNGKYKEFIMKMDNLTQVEFDSIYGDVLLSSPDLLITKDSTFTFDGEKLHILVTPGHVSDEIVVYHPRTRTLFAGDAIYEDRPHTKFGGAKEWKEWVQQLERFKKLETEYIVIGHGGLIDPNIIDTNINYLNQLILHTEGKK